MKHKRTKISSIILVVITLLAVAFVLFAVEKKQMDYDTEAVTRGNLKQVVTANGTLNPTIIAEIGTQVSGTVTKLYADVNDEVKKGGLIAEIDPALLEAELKQSKSQLEIARISFEQSARDYRRSQELFKKDYIARVEVEQAHQQLLSEKLSYESAKAQVEQDEVNLSYTKIKSPIDGVIIKREVTEGQTVASSFQAPTLFRIAASLVDMKIDVTIPESDVGRLQEGMPVAFTVDAYPNQEFEGELTSININPNSDQVVVTYSAVVSLKNEERLLFPGMTAYVNITLSEKQNVLKIPAAAFRFQPPKAKDSAFKKLFDPSTRYRRWRSSKNDNEQPSIYILRNDQLQKVEVEIGMMDERYVEVISDQVQEGDQVVLSAFDQEE